MNSVTDALAPEELGAARQVALDLARAGNLPAAEIVARLIAAVCPADFTAHLLLGQMYEAKGQVSRALTSYEAAMAASPGQGEPFTRRTTLLLRESMGSPRPPRLVPAGVPIVAMTTLGRNGRYGNQLLQYTALRLYADVVGAVALVPDWIGRDLFGLDDPLADEVPNLTPIGEEDATAVILGHSEQQRNAAVDLFGYFCPCVSRKGDMRRQIRSFFEPVPRIREIVDTCAAWLRDRGRTVVALHLRRGDFDGDRFWIPPVAWYRNWLEALWPTLDNPVLYIASDDQSTAGEFAEFRPLTAGNLPGRLPGAEFFIDHSMLQRADVVACSPSTFSITACQLNEGARLFAMPDRCAERLVAWSPWISSDAGACPRTGDEGARK